MCRAERLGDIGSIGSQRRQITCQRRQRDESRNEDQFGGVKLERVDCDPSQVKYDRVLLMGSKAPVTKKKTVDIINM